MAEQSVIQLPTVCSRTSWPTAYVRYSTSLGGVALMYDHLSIRTLTPGRPCAPHCAAVAPCDCSELRLLGRWLRSYICASPGWCRLPNPSILGERRPAHESCTLALTQGTSSPCPARISRTAAGGGHGIVQSDAPVVFVPIEARLLVFAPVVGQELEATVARHGSDHLALLAHGVINVTIPHSLIGSADQGDAVAARVGVAAGSTTVPGVRAERAGLDPPAAGAGGGVAGVGGGAGASEEKPELPAVGSSVRFVVRALHVDDGLMTVLGELR